MIKVAVLGAGGKMGKEVLKAVINDNELQLVAAIDPAYQGKKVSELINYGLDLIVKGSVEEIADARAEVAVDFTNANAAYESAKKLAENKIHTVIGTTGFSNDQINELANKFNANGVNLMVIPNFALGAVLMSYFAQIAAKFFHDVEIIELHHDQKKDAPSGTSLTTAKLINDVFLSQDSKQDELNFKTSAEMAARGEIVGRVRIHSVRLPGLVAHQEVIFGSPGQVLTIRHDSLERSSFMPGVLLAIKKIQSLKGVTTSLQDLLGV